MPSSHSSAGTLRAGQGSQVDAGRPTLGGAFKTGDGLGVRGHALQAQEFAGLPRAQCELRRADLEQAPGGALPGERQRRRGPPAQAELRTRRQLLQQHADELPAGLVGDEVGVIHDEDERRRGTDGGGKRREDAGGHRGRRQPQPVGHRRIDVDDAAEGGHEVAQKGQGVVVGSIRLEPGERTLVGLGPLRKGDGLAEPAGSRDHDERRRAGRQLRKKPVAAHELEEGLWRPKTRLE